MNYNLILNHIILVVAITLLLMQLQIPYYNLFIIPLVSILITRCFLGEIDFGMTFPMNDIISLLLLWIISLTCILYFDPKMTKK